MPRKPDLGKKERYYAPFPSNLRKIMADCGVTQQILANSIGVSRQMITNYQDGTALPNCEKLAAMAETLNVSTDWLLGRSNYLSNDTRELTLSEMQFSEKAASRIAALAGARMEAEEFGDDAESKVNAVMNPNGYSCRQESNAFLALNALLEDDAIVLPLSNAWQYIKQAKKIPQEGSIRFTSDETGINFSAPGEVLVNALWNRVTEPLRDICDGVNLNKQ